MNNIYLHIDLNINSKIMSALDFLPQYFLVQDDIAVLDVRARVTASGVAILFAYVVHSGVKIVELRVPGSGGCDIQPGEC